MLAARIRAACGLPKTLVADCMHKVGKVDGNEEEVQEHAGAKRKHCATARTRTENRTSESDRTAPYQRFAKVPAVTVGQFRKRFREHMRGFAFRSKMRRYDGSSAIGRTERGDIRARPRPRSGPHYTAARTDSRA